MGSSGMAPTLIRWKSIDSSGNGVWPLSDADPRRLPSRVTNNPTIHPFQFLQLLLIIIIYLNIYLKLHQLNRTQ